MISWFKPKVRLCDQCRSEIHGPTVICMPYGFICIECAKIIDSRQRFEKVKLLPQPYKTPMLRPALAILAFILLATASVEAGEQHIIECAYIGQPSEYLDKMPDVGKVERFHCQYPREPTCYQRMQEAMKAAQPYLVDVYKPFTGLSLTETESPQAIIDRNQKAIRLFQATIQACVK